VILSSVVTKLLFYCCTPGEISRFLLGHKVPDHAHAAQDQQVRGDNCLHCETPMFVARFQKRLIFHFKESENTCERLRFIESENICERQTSSTIRETYRKRETHRKTSKPSWSGLKIIFSVSFRRQAAVLCHDAASCPTDE
jgi:hypothetical protein